MTPKPFLAALTDTTPRRPGPPPIWLMRQAGRYLPEYRATREKAGGFLVLCYTPDLAAEVTLQPIRRFGFDAAILFSDILVVPDAMGIPVRFETGEGPVLDPVRDHAGIERLTPERIPEKLAPVYDAVALIRKELPATTALVGFAGAPWTVATYAVEGGTSRNFHRIRDWAYGDPEGFGHLIDKITKATVTHLLAQIEAGAEAVQIFDSWCSVLDDPGFARWSIGPTQTVIRALKARHPGVPVIGFPRAAGVRTEQYVRETGVDGVGICSAVPLGYAARTLQPLAAVQGNLDPRRLVAGGAAMIEEVRRIRTLLGAGRHIFNLGHGIDPDTPISHVEQLIETVRER